MKGGASLMKRMKQTVAVSAATVAVAVLMASASVRAQSGAPLADAPAPAAAPPAADPAQTGLSEGVVAIVNDNVISTYDLRQRVLLLMVTAGVRPTPENIPQVQQEALRSLVDEHIEVQEIKREEKEQKFEILATDDDVNKEISRMAQGNRMTGDQLLAALSKAGVGADTLRDQIRAQMSWERWIQGRFGGSRMKIGQDQVNAVIRSLEAEASKPQYQVSEIFIDATRAGGMEQATAGAKQLIGQMQQGAPFAAVARQFSSAPTAANGGDAGWESESELQPEVRAAISQIRAGQLSQPIVTRDGVYVILVRDKRAGSDSVIVQLKQAAISLPTDAPAAQVDAAQAKLIKLKSQITNCASVEANAAKVDGVVAGDLGQADVKDLAPSFQEAIKPLKVDQVSEPVRTGAGLHLIILCGKHQSGITVPSREEIASRIEDQQLSMISKRYLRDLRSSATVETR
jgi:peptidyl-prolyl cis-trans isomerase SurA